MPPDHRTTIRNSVSVTLEIASRYVDGAAKLMSDLGEHFSDGEIDRVRYLGEEMAGMAKRIQPAETSLLVSQPTGSAPDIPTS